MANTVQSDLQWERETGELIEGYDGSGGVIGFIHKVMISEPSAVRLKTHSAFSLLTLLAIPPST